MVTMCLTNSYQQLQTGAPDEGILEKEISELNDAVRVSYKVT